MLGVDYICLIGCNGCYYVGLGFTPHFTLPDCTVYFISTDCLQYLSDGDFKLVYLLYCCFPLTFHWLLKECSIASVIAIFIYIGLFIAYLSGAIIPPSS